MHSCLPPLNAINKSYKFSISFVKENQLSKNFKFLQWLSALSENDLNSLSDIASLLSENDIDSTPSESDNAKMADFILLTRCIRAMEVAPDKKLQINVPIPEEELEQISKLAGILSVSLVCEILRRQGTVQFVDGSVDGSLSKGDINVQKV